MAKNWSGISKGCKGKQEVLEHFQPKMSLGRIFKGEQRLIIIAPLPRVADLCYVAKLPLKLGSTPLFGGAEIQKAFQI